MIYQETLIGYTRPMNLVSMLIPENNTTEAFKLGDKNPNKPPKKKKKKKNKKVAEDVPVKKKRKKPRKEKAA